MYIETTEKLLDFIEKSPTAFQAVDEMQKRLTENGFEVLSEKEYWKLVPGGKYLVTRNNSALIAFCIPEKESRVFHIMASHSDSPSFKIKENPEIKVDNSYVKLNVEKYGGMLMAPWFDRPLSVAGRVIICRNDGLEEKLVDIKRDLVMIPNLAIHMNREANNGVAYNPQKDLQPLFAAGNTDRTLLEIIAEQTGVKKEDIISHDLFLYNRMPGTIWGADKEFVSSARLDDLQCAFTSMKGFLAAENEQNINVYACFDNEEVGSGTKQGAASTFLYDVLWRMNKALGKNEEEFHRAVAGSFMLSCDNAHAVHPNYRQKTDATNCVYMNDGIVIKSHAGQKYTSDAVSVAVFRMICEKAGVPLQYFANRSDEAGGSTLGNIAMTQVSMNTVDIGLPQLAMHSAYETAGVKDTEYMVKAVETFYASHIQADSDGNYQINQ